MSLRVFASYSFTVALIGLLTVGCDSSGSLSEDPSAPSEGDEGAVSFSLLRTANSDVPSDADSAFVRVWQPDGNFNLVEFLNIPDPGQQTKVSFDVPPDNGYRAGVIAVETPSNEVRAHGSLAQSFEVQSGDTTSVNLDPRPAEVSLGFPESIEPNRADTVSVTYEINVPGGNEDIRLRQGSDSTFFYNSGSIPETISTSETDSSATERFEISSPNVSDRDTTYLKVRTAVFNAEQWTTSEERLGIDYIPAREGSSFAIPVVPNGDEDGTVIITFSRDGDGWEKTRRVIE